MCLFSSGVALLNIAWFEYIHTDRFNSDLTEDSHGPFLCRTFLLSFVVANFNIHTF